MNYRIYICRTCEPGPFRALAFDESWGRPFIVTRERPKVGRDDGFPAYAPCPICGAQGMQFSFDMKLCAKIRRMFESTPLPVQTGAAECAFLRERFPEQVFAVAGGERSPAAVDPATPWILPRVLRCRVIAFPGGRE